MCNVLKARASPLRERSVGRGGVWQIRIIHMAKIPKGGLIFLHGFEIEGGCKLDIDRLRI